MEENMRNDLSEILIGSEELEERVRALGAQITGDYRGKHPLFLGVLKGCFIFMADLVRQVGLPCETEFIGASSYKNGTSTTGAVRLTRGLAENIEGRDVILVEDILDSGRTLSSLRDYLADRQPASLRIVTLLDKPSRREVALTADYVGFTVPNVFVVGYGMDFRERYRNLPYIGALSPRITESISAET